MKIFVKPSGIRVQVNSNSETHAFRLGWKPLEEPEPEQDEQFDLPEESADSQPKRRGRPPKVR